jgi:malate synthase
MTSRTTIHGLQVDTALKNFIDQQVLPAVGVDQAKFWQGFDQIVKDLSPKNTALLAERDRLQADLDGWHRKNPGPIQGQGRLPRPPGADRLPGAASEGREGDHHQRGRRLALQAGPQLVVPILNAPLRAQRANARWGSLYDALYGTDVIPETGGAEKGPATTRCAAQR